MTEREKERERKRKRERNKECVQEVKWFIANIQLCRLVRSYTYLEYFWFFSVTNADCSNRGRDNRHRKRKHQITGTKTKRSE